MAVLVVAAFAIALPAAAAEEESYIGAMVSEDGSVSLSFLYASLGQADSVAVIRTSPDGEVISRSVIKKENIPTDAEGRFVIKVELAAAQMSDSITVYTQKNGAKIGEEHTYSVKSYAERVLADRSLSEHHKALKSLLNYGAMAQSYFGVNTSALANADLYESGTNPIGAVSDISCAAPVWTEGDNIIFTGYEAILDSATAFRIYFSYQGDENLLVATVEREGIDPQASRVYFDSESGYYYVKISNIAPTLYGERYTVKVTDGAEELCVSASILNYLDNVIASGNTTDAQKNTARAMYQHYMWLAGENPAADECEHAIIHQESTNGATATAYVCSSCGALTKKVGDSVEINGSAEFIVSEYIASDKNQIAEIITDPDGTVFARLHGGRPNATFNSLYFHASTTKECGQYVVMKLRIPKNNPTPHNGKMHMHVMSTGAGSTWSRVEFTAPADGEWHIVVLDLTEFASSSTGYIPADDGKYYTQMLWLRPLTVGNTVGTVDDVMDIAYLAMCNNIEDVSSIIDEESYERHLSSTSFIPIDTATGVCVGKCLLEYSASGNTHSYKCAVCGSVDTEITVDSSLNYYSAPGTIKAEKGDVYGSSTDKNVYYEDGEIYQRIDVLNGGGTIPLTAGGGADEKHIVTANGSSGKYIVLRMRTHNIEKVVGLSWRIAAVAEGETFTKPGSYICERRAFEDDVWTTYVIDISTLGISGYSVNDTNKTKIVASLMVRADAASSGASLTDTYIDVAYFAICDNWDEIDIATGDEKSVFVTTWQGDAPLIETGPRGSCPEGECEYELDETEGIKYVCSICKSVVRVEVDASVNFYSAPGQVLNNFSAGYADNKEATWDHDLRYEDGKIYEHIALGGNASFKFDNGTSEEIRRFAATSTISGGSGRYLVIKMRANNIPVNVAIMLNTDTSSQGSNTNLNATAANTISRQSAFINGEWQVYVIDLLELGHQYYNAEDENVSKITFGFYIPALLAAHNASIDFEYAAICDDWSEIDKIVEEKMVKLSSWANNDPWKTVAAADGGPGVDTKGDDAEKLIYEKKGNDFYVYIRSPYAESYTRYKFSYNKNDAINYEGWQIFSVAICNSDLEVLYYATREKSTDMEGAILTYMSDGTAAKDFVGGFHGDEKYRSAKIIVDGVELDLSLDYPVTACTSVIAEVKSDVFRCETTEKIFDRTKTITWTEAGMEITNNYKVLVDIKVERPAVGMLVVYRDDNGYEDVVTKHWDHISNRWIDVVWPSQPSANYAQSGMTYAELDGNHIKASLEIKNFGVNGVQTTSRGWFNYDSWYVGNQRVKIYLDIFLRKDLKAGDNMHCTAVHTIFAKE